MPIDFPNSPANGATYDYNGVRYTFKTTAGEGYWQILSPASIGGIAIAKYAAASQKRNWPTLANSTVDAEHDIDFSAGIILDSTGEVPMEVAAMTKRIDATWAAGDGNGGRVGSLGQRNTFHCFVISKEDGTTDFGFDNELDASVLMAAAASADFVYHKYIGTIITDGTSNIRAFYQRGDTFSWVTPLEDVHIQGGYTNTTELSWRPIGSIPDGLKCQIDMNVYIGDAEGENNCLGIYFYTHDGDASHLPATIPYGGGRPPFFQLFNQDGAGDPEAMAQLTLWTNDDSSVTYQMRSNLASFIPDQVMWSVNSFTQDRSLI